MQLVFPALEDVFTEFISTKHVLPDFSNRDIRLRGRDVAGGGVGGVTATSQYFCVLW